MNAARRLRSTAARKRERGAALLITTMMLVVLAALAFTSMRYSEQESTGSARSRAGTRTFYAADSGIQLAMSHLAQDPADLTAFDVNLANGANVQSRAREELLPSALDELTTAAGEPQEGESLNVGTGIGTVTRIYRVTVTATSPNGATAEVDAKIGRVGTEATGH